MKPHGNHTQAVRNYLVTMHNLTERKLEIDSQIKQLVKAAVLDGATWREVGEALGVSGQAAWERYRPDPPPKRRPGI